MEEIMAIEHSVGLKNAAGDGLGIYELLKGLRIFVYEGSDPGIEVAPTGNLLAVYTDNKGTFIDSSRALGTITITGGSGSVDTIKVGGMAEDLLGGVPVSFVGDVTQTAAAVAAQINASKNALDIVADNASGVVNLYAPAWMGALADGLDLVSASTTLGAADVDFAGGVSETNGLDFDFPAVAGVLSKAVAQVWSALVAITGTAGYFRAVPAGSTVNGTSGDDIRFSGLCGSSGADLNLSSVSLIAGATDVITQFDLNIGQ
jgi:hypothetical protein